MNNVFSFETEEIGPDLDLMPLAARRAVDHAGLHLPLAGWRSLQIDARRRLVLAGGRSEVDVADVASIVAEAQPVATPVDPVADPAPDRLPPGLSAEHGVDVQRWASLAPLARYALVHAIRRANKRNDPSILTTAIRVLT